MLLSCPEEGRGRKWEESTSLQWFNTLHPKLLTVLMSMAKQPFQDLRLAGLRVLLTMSSFEWGQRQFQEHAGFLEYLLDRSTEHDKEGRELKYEIVHSLVGSGSIAETVFGNVDLLKLRKYDREGPFYSSADTTIALEGM
jgi:26S proteasome non-ATPase regulatory subunit 5